jgi:hypothetical protein
MRRTAAEAKACRYIATFASVVKPLGRRDMMPSEIAHGASSSPCFDAFYPPRDPAPYLAIWGLISKLEVM